MNRTGAGVERASQMPTWGDQRLRRVFPSLELTTATCGAEHWRRQMRHMMRLQAMIRQMESVASALWKVQRGSVALWSSLSGKRGK